MLPCFPVADAAMTNAAKTLSRRSETLPVIVVEPPRGWSALNLRDLWAHRDLIYFLAWRDVKVRYAQASIGVAWSIAAVGQMNLY